MEYYPNCKRVALSHHHHNHRQQNQSSFCTPDTTQIKLRRHTLQHTYKHVVPCTAWPPYTAAKATKLKYSTNSTNLKPTNYPLPLRSEGRYTQKNKEIPSHSAYCAYTHCITSYDLIRGRPHRNCSFYILSLSFPFSFTVCLSLVWSGSG